MYSSIFLFPYIHDRKLVLNTFAGGLSRIAQGRRLTCLNLKEGGSNSNIFLFKEIGIFGINDMQCVNLYISA